ncbi:MAG TPA: hypothetical protein VIX17_00700 [Pyrinomonadaceae bacterium]|jgi:hypothetical protein
MSQNNTSEQFNNDLRERMRIHQAIGNLIGESKAKLFQTSREGGDIVKACNRFVTDIMLGFGRMFARPDLFGAPHVHEDHITAKTSKDEPELLTDEQLDQIVEDICGKNYDNLAASALVLLMDEIERRLEHSQLEDLAIHIGRRAFTYTTAECNAQQALIASMRGETEGNHAAN